MSRRSHEKCFLYEWRDAVASAESVLSATQRHVALTLSLHMDRNGGSCWPSILLLCKRTSLADSTVRKALTEVDRAGYLRREVGTGRGRSTRYSATLPAAEGRRDAAAFDDANPPSVDEKPPSGANETAVSRRQGLSLRVQEQRASPAAGCGDALLALDEECMVCGERPARDDGERILCDPCRVAAG